MKNKKKVIFVALLALLTCAIIPAAQAMGGRQETAAQTFIGGIPVAALERSLHMYKPKAQLQLPRIPKRFSPATAETGKKTIQSCIYPIDCVNDRVVCDGTCATQLHTAVRNTNKEKVQLLLAYKANVNAQSYYGETPLKCGAKSAQLLLEHKAEIDNSVWNSTTSPLRDLYYQAYQQSLRHQRCYFFYNQKPVLDLLFNWGLKIGDNFKAFDNLSFANYDAKQDFQQWYTEHVGYLEQNPPAYIVQYTNELPRVISEFISVRPLAGIVADYLLHEKTNQDLIIDLNQTRADEIVAARDARYKARMQTSSGKKVSKADVQKYLQQED